MPWPPSSIPQGGTDMVWNYSNGSTSSTRSRYSDASGYLSPTTTMSSYGTSPPLNDYSTTYNFTSYAESPQRSSSIQSSTSRATPNNLGWLPNTELWKLYKFVVTKGKEPYLDLLPEWTVTEQTPERVYLDPSPNPRKGVYPCQFPGGCEKSSVFGRPADLDRHYKNVHASVDQKDSFPCDYGPCNRSKDKKPGPFTRKDHYRDHLKDFHKEDIGHAKVGKMEKDSKDWRRAQREWVRERRISAKWWRCRVCLLRIYVDKDGWECQPCNLPCEAERIVAREKLSKRNGEAVVDSRSQYEATPSSNLYAGCVTCNGQAWVRDMIGGWEACPNCQPAPAPTSSVSTSTYYATPVSDDWDNTQYTTSSYRY